MDVSDGLVVSLTRVSEALPEIESVNIIGLEDFVGSQADLLQIHIKGHLSRVSHMFESLFNSS